MPSTPCCFLPTPHPQHKPSGDWLTFPACTTEAPSLSSFLLSFASIEIRGEERGRTVYLLLHPSPAPSHWAAALAVKTFYQALEGSTSSSVPIPLGMVPYPGCSTITYWFPKSHSFFYKNCPQNFLSFLCFFLLGS